MTTTHSGPPHDPGCLTPHVSEARCSCSRRDWLREMVPRHQARAELLGQLAEWAHEQRVFATADMENQSARERQPGAPGWLAAASRAAAHVAEEVYLGVRRRALAMQGECASAAEVKLPEERPVETAKVQETLL